MLLHHFLLILLVILVWGFNFVVIKIGLNTIPPIFLVFARFFFTCFPAIFFIKKPKAPLKLLISYGIVMFALQFAFLFMAMESKITPALASLLLQVQVFFALALASLVFKEKIYKSQLFGALIAFSGILLIITNLGAEVTLNGFLLVMAAAACAAPGNAISKKIGTTNVLGLIVWGSLFASPFLLALSFIFEGKEKILLGLTTLSWEAAGSVFYIVYLSTFFGFYVWNLMLSKYPLSKVTPFSLLSPVFGTLSSCLVLNEKLFSWKILAGALVLFGLLINVVGPKYEMKPESSPIRSESP